MTRRHLALFAGVLLLCGAAINAPAPAAEAAAIKPAAITPVAHTLPLGIRIGDGVLSLRIRLCDRCGAQLTFEINLPVSPDLKVGPTAHTVNHQPLAAY